VWTGLFMLAAPALSSPVALVLAASSVRAWRACVSCAQMYSMYSRFRSFIVRSAGQSKFRGSAVVN